MSKEVDPRMHTAEHLLNQTMIMTVGSGRCFSAHIEKKKSKCDYHFERNLTDEEKNKIEETINNLIKEDLKVTEEFLPRTEAESKYNLIRLPEGAGDNIRIIKIGDYDSCPCVGEHVASTKELIGFRIISTDFQNGVLRIRYKLTVNN